MLPPPPGKDDDLLPPPPTASTSTSAYSSKPSSASKPAYKPAPAAYFPPPDTSSVPPSAEEEEEAERKARIVEKIKRQQAQYQAAVIGGTPLPDFSPPPGPKTHTVGLEPDFPLVQDDGKGPWCANCGGPLKGSQIMEVGGREYHPRCFVCFSCRKPLTGQLLTVAEKYFHPACMVCKHCGTPLQGKQFVVNPSNHQLYCPDHARVTATGTGIKCMGCQLPISGKEPVVNAMNGQWHRLCFVCEHCKETLVGQPCIVHTNKKPYCEKDFEMLFKTKCVACGEVIEGQVLEIGDGLAAAAYHPSCFKCNTCQKVLKGAPFYLRENAAYCEAHAAP